MIVPGNGDVVSLLRDEGGYVYGSVQDLAPKEVLWLVRMEGCPRDFFSISLVNGRTVNLRVALRANLVVSGHLSWNRII